MFISGVKVPYGYNATYLGTISDVRKDEGGGKTREKERRGKGESGGEGKVKEKEKGR